MGTSDKYMFSLELKCDNKGKKKPLLYVTVSDIHIGHPPSSQLSYEFFNEEEGLIQKIKEVIIFCQESNIEFGGVIIAGDLFDRPIALNSNNANLAIEFVYTLTTLVVDSNGIVIIIRGTRSHDLNQLSIFKHFETLPNFRNSFFIFETVTAIRHRNYSILLIPEEYMKNQQEFYAPYFDGKEYDMVFGHGFFKFNCFNKNEVERPMAEMPIFDHKKIEKLSRVTIFGHDHNFTNYKDSIYYGGSWTRLCHGEEADKGGLILYIDEKQVSVERLVNTLAPTFVTVKLETMIPKSKSIETVAVEDLVKKINKYKKSVDNLKIKVSLKTVKLNPALVEVLVSTFQSHSKKGIIIDSPPFSVKNGKLLILADSTKESDSAKEEKFSYLHDSKLSLPEKIKIFIDEKHSNSFSVEEISTAIQDTN